MRFGGNAPGIPGGREVVKEIIELFYASQKDSGISGCKAYVDFHEFWIKTSMRVR
jgi:hypothetical protein